MTENLSDNVFKKIQEEKIAPKARWQFVLQTWLVRVFFVISIMLGGISFGIIFYLLQVDWSGYQRVAPSAWRFFIAVLPYFWLLSSAFGLLAAYWNFSHSRRGYRFSLEKIMALNLGTSLLLGLVFFMLGLAPVAENLFMSLSPFYHNSMLGRERVWQQPTAGVLAGQIFEVQTDGSLRLVDLDRERWLILRDNETQVGSSTILQKGEWVRVFGSRTESSEKVFLAREIRPLGPPGRHLLPLIPRSFMRVLSVAE